LGSTSRATPARCTIRRDAGEERQRLTKNLAGLRLARIAAGEPMDKVTKLRFRKLKGEVAKFVRAEADACSGS